VHLFSLLILYYLSAPHAMVNLQRIWNENVFVHVLRLR